MQVRLQKYLADAGVGSRRACEKLIADGQVQVNKQMVTSHGVKIDPGQDVVTVDYGASSRRSVRTSTSTTSFTSRIPW